MKHVVEYYVVQGQDVLHLHVSEAVLGRRQVAEGVRDQHTAVVALHAVQETVNGQTDGSLDGRLVHRVVR